jgi:peptidoglycan hydrolase-like protein with peptidoglycan-binding domain
VQAILDGNEVPEPIHAPPTDGNGDRFPILREGDGFFDGPHPEYRSAVKACQIMLAHHDFADTGTVDGDCAADGAFGSGTKEQVKAFQFVKQLTSDGICGPDTWEALRAPRTED